MGTVFTVGDTLPALTGRCHDDDDVGVDMTAAQLQVHVRRPAGEPLSRAAVGDALGQWAMPWQAGDLSVSGTWWAEVQATWPDGGILTFGPTPFRVRPQIA
jgi:hypothetical protein